MCSYDGTPDIPRQEQIQLMEKELPRIQHMLNEVFGTNEVGPRSKAVLQAEDRCCHPCIELDGGLLTLTPWPVGVPSLSFQAHVKWVDGWMLEAVQHYPGNYHEPPDVDFVELECDRDINTVLGVAIKHIAENMWNAARQAEMEKQWAEQEQKEEEQV